jgi:hypothetical protein
MSDLETQSGSDDLRSTLESAFAEAASPETTTETVAEPAVSAEPEKTEKVRDESGKFAKKEPEPVEKPVEKQTDTPIEKTEPEAPVKRAPSSWKKETQAEWEKLPSHVQEDVLRREADFHKGIEQYKQHAQKAQVYEQAIAPYQRTLQQMGVAPEQAIGALFKADDLLRNSAPHEKAAYFAQLAKDYGVQLDEIKQPPQVDPAYQQLLNEVRSLKTSEFQREQQRQQAEQQSLNSTIAKFSEGKEHFDAVREDMAALLQAGRAQDLEAAYDMAIWARPDLRSGLLQQQTQAAEERARASIQAKRAQSASVSVKGSSPVSTHSANPNDLRAILESQFNS